MKLHVHRTQMTKISLEIKIPMKKSRAGLNIQAKLTIRRLMSISRDQIENKKNCDTVVGSHSWYDYRQTKRLSLESQCAKSQRQGDRSGDLVFSVTGARGERHELYKSSVYVKYHINR